MLARGIRIREEAARTPGDEVFQHGERRKIQRVLVEHPDPVRDGVGGRGQGDRLTIDHDLAAVGGLVAGHDFHQGAFARAVFAEDRVNLSRLEGERNILIGAHPAKCFRDVVQFDSHKFFQ